MIKLLLFKLLGKSLNKKLEITGDTDTVTETPPDFLTLR